MRQLTKSIALMVLVLCAADAQVTLTGSITDDAGSKVSVPVSLLLRKIPESVRAVGRGHMGIISNPDPFETVVQSREGEAVFVLPPIPDGLYLLCANTSDMSYVSNCEFSNASDAYFRISSGRASKALNVTMRRSSVVEITVSDPKRLIRENAFHFSASIISGKGQVKTARLVRRDDKTLVLAASMPLGEAATVYVDTRLQVFDASGRRLDRLQPSTIHVTGDSPVVRVALQVTAQDLDLQPVVTAGGR